MPEFPAWEVLRAHTAFSQPPWLTVIQQDVRLPDGGVIHDYLLAPGRDYSLIVALTDQGEALLVEQYKHGPERPVVDFPAGYLEGDEDPLLAAQRELLEETGWQAREWTALGGFLLDANRSANRVHIFLARGLEQVADLALDPTENLRAFRRPWADVAALIAADRMSSAASVAAWGLVCAWLASAS